MAKGGPAAPRFLGPLLVLVLLAVLGLVVLAAAKIGSALKHDWKTVSDMRSRDAAQVLTEREAGKGYIDKLALVSTAVAAQRAGDGASGATLSWEIANKGNKDVIKAVAKVKFLPEKGDEAIETRDVILFDASELSVTTDKPLIGGETRTLVTKVADVNPNWPGSRISYEITEVRINVGRE